MTRTVWQYYVYTRYTLTAKCIFCIAIKLNCLTCVHEFLDSRGILCYFRPQNVASLTTSVLERKKKPHLCDRTFGSRPSEPKEAESLVADVYSQNGAIPAIVQRQHLLLISWCFLFAINTFDMLISHLFSVRSRMGDAQCKVSSSNNKATLAEVICWLCSHVKDQTKR